MGTANGSVIDAPSAVSGGECLVAACRQQDSVEIERPHEILGLRRDERDPITIVNAAWAKLRCIRGADGGERAVSRAVASLIVRARDQLLERTASPVGR